MQVVGKAFIALLHGWLSARGLFACPLACRESPCRILSLECGASESGVFTSPRVGFCPAMCQRGDMELRPKRRGCQLNQPKPWHRRLAVLVSPAVSLHPEAVQDGSVWLMISKTWLRRLRT